MTENSHERLPSYFLAGCTKSASTWLWKCFIEHPEIYVPTEIDRLNFFSIHYYKGFDWYREFYNNVREEKAIVDPTPEYIKDPLAPQRIHEFSPDSKFIFTLRNPIDRAFSLWWHQKRKGHINYNFNDVFQRKQIGSFNLYDEWVISGFYLIWLQNFFKLFPQQNIKVMIFDDLENDPSGYIKEVFQFLNVDDTFVPSIIDAKVNTGNKKKETQSLVHKAIGLLNPSNPYEAGMNEEIRSELRLIFEPQNRALGEYLNRDLSFWK